MSALVEIKDVCKVYNPGENEVRALDHVSLTIDEQEFVAIIGHSGSGKSTLMNMLGCLDVPTSGEYWLHGQDVSALSDDALSDIRNREIGFIFQGFNLIPNLTVRENICVCRYLTDQPMDIDELLEVLGLTEHQDKFPSQLSGGQQQRCAIARALVKNPKLLLCDEPTGALDSKTSRDILMLLEKVNQRYGTTILIVTHNNAIKNMVHQVIFMKDGIIRENYENAVRISASELEDL